MSLVFVTQIPTSSTNAQQANVLGNWQFSGGASERQAIDQAITHAIRNLNPVIRGIASSRLREVNQPFDQVALSADGTDLVCRFNQHSIRTPSDGSIRRVRVATGRNARVSQLLGNGEVVQTIRNRDGQRRNTYRLLSDGRMQVTVRITSPQLPEAITYQLTYTRR